MTPTTNRPEPVEAYAANTLPPGTKFRFASDAKVYISYGQDRTDAPVYVVEWPQRTYDGIPADDLDVVVDGSHFGSVYEEAAERIRAAIAAQDADATVTTDRPRWGWCLQQAGCTDCPNGCDLTSGSVPTEQDQ